MCMWTTSVPGVCGTLKKVLCLMKLKLSSGKSLYGWNIEEQEISIPWQARKPVSGANTQICFSWHATCATHATSGHVGMVWAGWTSGYYLG